MARTEQRSAIAEGTGYGGKRWVCLWGRDGLRGCRALELLPLGDGFAFDIVFADGAAQESLNEVDERGAKNSCRRGDEGGMLSGRDGGSVSEDDLTATPRVGLAWAMARRPSKAAPVAHGRGGGAER